MLPNFQLKSAYPGGYIHLDSALCREGPNPFQQSFLCPPVDSEVYPHIADPITIIFHRQRSSRNCIRLFHVKRAVFHMVFGNLPYPIYNLSCLKIIPTYCVCFPDSSFHFSKVAFIFQPHLCQSILFNDVVGCFRLYHTCFTWNILSWTIRSDVNRYRIVFILVYISAVVEQQYIFVVNYSVSRETSFVHIVFLCFHLFQSFRG